MKITFTLSARYKGATVTAKIDPKAGTIDIGGAFKITIEQLKRLKRLERLGSQVQELLKTIELTDDEISREIVYQATHLSTELSRFVSDGSKKVTGREIGV